MTLQTSHGVARTATPPGAALTPGASEQRTTSDLQPPSWKARLVITTYVNLFGAGLLVVFAVAGWAMLLRLGEVGQATMSWQGVGALEPWLLVALLVCSLPYILAFGAVSLYRWSVFSRYGIRLQCRARSANPSLMDDHEWRDLTQRAVKVWNYEALRFSESRRMAGLDGLIFGLITSLTLFICTMIVAPYLFRQHGNAGELELVAIAVGTATAFSFANDLGRILFRVALRDAGPEIFSFATKNSIQVVASALLFSTLLCSGLAQMTPEHSIPLGVPGFIVIGATIAVIGGRAVRFVSDRAANALGMTAARAVEPSDLTQIEGLAEEDIGRLAEEGIDSLHALAFIPLPRLLFNTKYGLERLCDWQDQALLLIHVGQAKARLLHEHLLVRGAIAAQDAAQRFFSRPPDGSEPAGVKAGESEEDKLANQLGFASHECARFALNEIANDEDVNRLRVYVTAAHTLEWSRDGGATSGATSGALSSQRV